MLHTERAVMNLEGKVACITGGSYGIGANLALGFTNAGATVAIVARGRSRADETADRIRAAGGKTLVLAGDVRSKADMQAAADAVVGAFGRIDILINNAGVAGAAPSEDLDEGEWDRIVDINLKGTFLCCQAFGRQMLRQKSGKIVNVSSVAGLGAFPKRAAYGASKAAVIMLTKVLAVEWADRNVQVNAIAPGVIRTQLNEEMIARGNLDLAAINRRTPIGRRGETEDVLGAVVYLSSSASDYVTGAVLAVDGGWSAYSFL
jgi:NAD(P)-dependent dehydrogenase (short-subunit alcohol dehydrogenase family)